VGCDAKFNTEEKYPGKSAFASLDKPGWLSTARKHSSSAAIARSRTIGLSGR